MSGLTPPAGGTRPPPLLRSTQRPATALESTTEVARIECTLGRHADPARCLAFAPERQWTGYGMHHLVLLSREEVYTQLRDWLARDDQRTGSGL